MVSRIDRAAKDLGIPRSSIIRMLVERFVDTYEQNGGKITMPIQVTGASESAPEFLKVAESPEKYGSDKV